MRLIDADAASALIESLRYLAQSDYGSACYNDGVNDALAEIEDAETVDDVLVVRCKDCKFLGHHKYPNGEDDVYECEAPYVMLSQVCPEDFCSCAVKKEETE